MRFVEPEKASLNGIENDKYDERFERMKGRVAKEGP
jgi:hypothetical protein